MAHVWLRYHLPPPPHDINAISVYHSTVGLEYELRLKKRLTILGVPFLDEEDLRKRGHDKTPDVLLDVPIGKGGEEAK